MSTPSAIPAKIGFYLLLLFSFSVAVFPRLSIVLAAAAFFVWLLEVVIFRKFGWMSSPVFYPLAGFVSFSVLAFLISAVLYGRNWLPCTAIFSVMYFVAREFVPSPERRKMVVWTFISGVVLSAGIDLFHRWGNLFELGYMEGTSDASLSFLMVMVFCLVIAYYAQAEKSSEKIFFGLITLPVAVVAFFSFDWAVVVILLLIFLAVGIIKDRTVLVIFSLAAVIVVSGIFGAGEYIVETVNAGRIVEFAKSPLQEFKQETETLSGVTFFGSSQAAPQEVEEAEYGGSFIFSLLKRSGPPSVLFFFWILIEQTRRDLLRIRKISSREFRAYNLASLLIVAAVFVSGFYAPTLTCAPAILGLWLLLGMAEC
jgi:hypothetical protein